MAESYGRGRFNFLKNDQTFLSDCAILRSHELCVNIPVLPDPCWLGVVKLFNFSYSSRLMARFHYGFNLYFPKTNDVERISTYLFAIHVTFLVKYTFTSLGHCLKIGWLAGSVSGGCNS